MWDIMSIEVNGTNSCKSLTKALRGRKGDSIARICFRSPQNKLMLLRIEEDLY
jgi:hypothetical protein